MVPPWRLGLRHRVALSFLAISVLVAGLLIATATGLVATYETALYVNAADEVALNSANAIAASTAGSLPPDPASQHGNQSATGLTDVVKKAIALPLAEPHVTGLQAGAAPAEMVVDPSGKVFDTSYPDRFPVGANLRSLVPRAGSYLGQVLEGFQAHGDAVVDRTWVAWSLQPLFSRLSDPFGAVYVQMIEPPFPAGGLVGSFLYGVLPTLGILTPFGVAAGVLTMRSTVQRIGGLVEASGALARGEFARRVKPAGHDEITTLQHQFNAMAARLQEAVTRERELAADHARLGERERIARDIHDSICQEMFSLRLTVGALELSRSSDLTLREQLIDVNRGLNSCIRQMRVVLMELRPPGTPALELPAALEELVAIYRARVSLEVEADVEPLALAAPLRDGLLRIAQEALANAARHSGADRVRVSLRRVDQAVELRVVDNGRGFEPGSPAVQHGLGLRSLDQRARELGGVLRIESAPGSGTAVVVTAPA